jgi:hypothetical protein
LKENKGMKKAKGPLLLLKLDPSGAPMPESTNSETPPADAGTPGQPPEPPAFTSLPKHPSLFGDLLRLLLIILSLVVAAGFVLILLPQPTVDRMTRDLQARNGKDQQEKVAFLYLGDEIKDNEFHIRGVVRNITTAPIEGLDAAVRLYGHDGNALETTIVRMNKETIGPDEVAQFELVYPNYKNEIMKYSVEFKLRDGPLVPYKDMRNAK